MKYLPLFLILILAFILRVYGLNWDQGFHLHPDERAIVIASIPLQLPTNISELLSVQSPLNPHFFAYGSLPMYLLKGVAVLLTPFYPLASSYDHINLVGRFLSVIFDMGTILIIFLLGQKLFSRKVGLIAVFFYTISVFPIQAAHFYAVDTPLTFFILATLYMLISFYENPTKKKALFVGILFGMSLATKTSALVLIMSIGAALISDFVLIFLRIPHRPHIWFPHIPKLIKKLLIEGLIILISTVISFIIFEPYALLDFKEFSRQTLEQSQMTHNPFAFPFTLQYVGKIPYFYELKNIFFWGQGPIIATISFLGTLYISFHLIKRHLGWWRSNDFDSSEVDKRWAQELILLIFFLSYFIVVGKFAVGWMRYMLPLYPLLSLFAAVLAYKLLILIKRKFGYWYLFVVLVFICSILYWPLSFVNIYTKPNTRVLASEWINQNIPVGPTLAIEHWDDSLPLFGQEKYKMLTLPLYDPDTSEKWKTINQELSKTDYIIIASNRLYTPLMRLTDCKKLPVGRCYTQTSEYYKKLFSGSLGFKKVAEFTSYPKFSFPLVKWEHEINDSSADESFTVYDHPKVLIFQKIP
ncbi:MAG: glycosyltransferase family 39 protein [Candidatus Levybacteria bacterium]|nr:glycosyltransferase family 39 protein [Candidatus Levybacteria bacterium]